MNITDRFKTQRVSQKIHFKNRLASKNKEQYRVENCYKLKTKTAHQVTLRKKEGAAKAHYGDLQTCGSVWACPVDASIISERRKIHTQDSIDIWRNKGESNVVNLITTTTPHYIFQSLKDVLFIQDKAIKIMKNQPQRGSYKVYKTIMDEMCSIGAYTGREVTYGKNGWHPHRHDLHFTVKATIDQLMKWKNELSYAFAVAFKKAGGQIKDINSFMQRSVKIDQINDDDGFTRISSYVTTVDGGKWSIAQETTKGIVKTAKNGNITPFGMLQEILQGNQHSGLYSLKFFEFARTMHGKKQFFPTPGLNRFFGLNWKTDKELMLDNDAGNHYATLTDLEWFQINTFEIRGEVLALTENKNEFEFMRDLDLMLKEYQLDKTG